MRSIVSPKCLIHIDVETIGQYQDPPDTLRQLPAQLLGHVPVWRPPALGRHDQPAERSDIVDEPEHVVLDLPPTALVMLLELVIQAPDAGRPARSCSEVHRGPFRSHRLVPRTATGRSHLLDRDQQRVGSERDSLVLVVARCLKQQSR